MKHNLGKVLTLYLFLGLSLLFAEDFAYTFTLDKKNPYLKEPVIMTLDLNQTNHDIVILFQFDLQKSDAYYFRRLSAKVTDMHHDARVHYTYLIHPLKTGDINITFNLVKRVTNDAAVSYSFSGDRDDFKKLETVDTRVPLPPLTIPVKPLPKHIQFIGDFKLSYKIKTHQAKSFEPIPLQIVLEGYGYPPSIEHMIPKSNDFSIFEQKPTVKEIPAKQGIKYTAVYHFALSAEKSFTLPEITLHALNPATHKTYELHVPQQEFTVNREDPHSLVDRVDNPAPFSTDWSWLKTLLSCLLVFTAGYMTAWTLKWKKKSLSKEENPLKAKIAACQDEKSLLRVLMAADCKRFVTLIETLENSLYKNGKINFSKIKQSALEQVS